MSRLYDKLMSDIVAPPLPNVESFIDPRTGVMTTIDGRRIDLGASTTMMRRLLSGAEVIDATNVQKAFADGLKQPGALDLTREIHALIPPFEKFFIEWDWADVLRLVVPGALRSGILVLAFRDMDRAREVLGEIFEDPMASGTLLEGLSFQANIHQDDSAGWILIALDFVEFRKRPDQDLSGLRGPFNAWFWIIGVDGTPLSHSSRVLTDAMPEEEATMIAGIDLCGWIALSIMSCDNIDTEVVEAPAKLNKKRKKRGKKPLVSYRTIRVNPDKGPRASSSKPTAGKNRRHKRRGHIKDYRKGKGLFGKYKGLWYWGPALCGNASEGVVVSDYSVEGK